MKLSERIRNFEFMSVAIAERAKEQWADEAEQLEEQIDDLLNKLLAGEELYISRGMEIVQLEKKNEALMRLAGMYIKSYEDLVFGGAEHEEYEIGREEQDDDSNTL